MAPIDDARRELLVNAIADIQGSIHANDSKSSAGLVVHGLLVTGVVALSTRLGDVYSEATGGVRGLLIGLLAFALLVFVYSVGSLLMAVNPYYPTDVAKRLPSDPAYAKVFFPDITALKDTARAGGDREATQLGRLLDELASPDALEKQLTGELLKVADIRDHEARWAQRGFRGLALEVLLVSLYFALVGVVAAGLFHRDTHHTHPQPKLSWRVTSSRGASTKLLVADATVTLKAPARVTITLFANDAKGLARVEMTARSTYTCTGRSAVRTIQASIRRLRSPLRAGSQAIARKSTRVIARRVSIRRRHCPKGTRYSGATITLSGRAVSNHGTSRTGLLRVSAPR
jgi:hypothetical protein